jgi:hypothetical protein
MSLDDYLIQLQHTSGGGNGGGGGGGNGGRAPPPLNAGGALPSASTAQPASAFAERQLNQLDWKLGKNSTVCVTS